MIRIRSKPSDSEPISFRFVSYYGVFILLFLALMLTACGYLTDGTPDNELSESNPVSSDSIVAQSFSPAELIPAAFEAWNAKDEDQFLSLLDSPFGFAGERISSKDFHLYWDYLIDSCDENIDLNRYTVQVLESDPRDMGENSRGLKWVQILEGGQPLDGVQIHFAENLDRWGITESFLEDYIDCTQTPREWIQDNPISTGEDVSVGVN